MIKLNSEQPKNSTNSFVDKRTGNSLLIDPCLMRIFPLVKKNVSAPPNLKIIKAQEKDAPSPIYRNSPNSNLMPSNGKTNTSSPFASPKHDNSSLKSPVNSATKASSNSSFKSLSNI